MKQIYFLFLCRVQDNYTGSEKKNDFLKMKFVCPSWMFIWATVFFLCVDYGTCPGSTGPLLTYERICSNGLCYKGYGIALNYDDAWNYCHNSSRHLVMPKSDAEYTFIRTNITGWSGHMPVWIGVTDVLPFDPNNLNQFDLRWNDYMPVYNCSDRYKINPLTDSRGDDEPCIEIEENGWDNEQCSDKDYFICQEYETECKATSPFYYNGKCYRLHTDKQTFSLNLCNGTGERLAMPKTSKDIAYIRNINLLDVPLWIGLNGSSNTSAFWFDGDPLTTTQAGFFFDESRADLPFWTGYLLHTGQYSASNGSESFQFGYVCEVELPCLPINIKHGESIADPGKQNDVVPLVCDVNAWPVNDTTTCMDGKWGPPPICDCLEYCVCLSLNQTHTTDFGDLLVNEDELSKTRRKLTSAQDDRPTSRYIGLTGVSVIVSTITLLLLSDCTNFFRKFCGVKKTVVKKLKNTEKREREL